MFSFVNWTGQMNSIVTDFDSLQMFVKWFAEQQNQKKMMAKRITEDIRRHCIHVVWRAIAIGHDQTEEQYLKRKPHPWKKEL